MSHGVRPPPIAVLGAGAWGTALALLLARNGHAVRLWSHDAAQLAALGRERCNARYLPNVALPADIRIDAALDRALDGCDWMLIAVPSAGFADTLTGIAAHRPVLPVAWATKGLAPDAGRLLHELAAEALGERPLAAISGPSFAQEVAQGQPTALVVASKHSVFADQVAAALRGPSLRAYTSTDVVGVGLAGAVKNVLAIAAGIADGLGFGANTRAALITRGLAEMTRLGLALGGRAETFAGLCGLGDLVLTATDDQSRNRRFGLALARGLPQAAAEQGIGQVVEGIAAARETERLRTRHGIDMPIAQAVYRVLYENLAPREAVQMLLQREPRSEV